MLALTRKSDYALVALSHLAIDEGAVSSAREIACRYDIPLAILMNIMKTLAQHNLVTSVRGSRGGYKLAEPAKDISLFRVINAIEGPIRLFPCADNEPSGNGNDSGNGCGNGDGESRHSGDAERGVTSLSIGTGCDDAAQSKAEASGTETNVEDSDDESGCGCGREGYCPISGPAQAVNERLLQYLDEVTLDEIAQSRVPSVASRAAKA